MLGKVFDRFVEKSPLSVMVRGLLDRVLGAEQLDAWYARTVEKQYTRTRLFSTVHNLLSHVVFGIQPSLHAAYRQHEDIVGTSVVAVSHTLNGVETHTSAELGRYSATVVRPLMAQVGGGCAPGLPGMRVKMVDGNCLEATEHRRKALRTLHAGALPGKSLGVYEPAAGLGPEVLPCEDGHAQERSLCGAVLQTVQAGDLWMQERHVCPWAFLCDIARRGAFFITRQHAGLPDERVPSCCPAGRMETGRVAEQRVVVRDAQGTASLFRRLRVQLDEPTRDGDRVLSLWTHGPLRKASPKRVARLSRKRWTLETAFQRLEASFHSAIHPLGSPTAAVCGFCLALVAYNMMAVVVAALRRVHGEHVIEHDVSLYSMTNELATTSTGLMIAIPEHEWRVFRSMSLAEIVATLLALARKVRLRAWRKSPRGPKKPRPKRAKDPKRAHVATAKLLMNRKGNLVAP